MEDAHVCEPNLSDSNDTALYGVFDGHCGAEVARYVGRHISDVLKKDAIRILGYRSERGRAMYQKNLS